MYYKLYLRKSMYVAPTPLPNLPNQGKYQIDAIQKLVEHVTKVHSKIATLQDEVKSIGLPSILSMAKMIHNMLYNLQCHLSSIGSLQ